MLHYSSCVFRIKTFNFRSTYLKLLSGPFKLYYPFPIIISFVSASICKIKKPPHSKIHRERSLAFDKNYVNIQLSFWNKHLWVHESKINFLKSNGAQKIQKKEDETYKLNSIRGTVKVGGCNVMVWESMTWNRAGKLECIDGIMDFEAYDNILKKIQKNILFFNITTTPTKRQRKKNEFFIQNQIELLEWPAQSYDLNPIKRLWAILDQKAGAQCLKKNEELKFLLQEEWTQINPDTTKKLVESIQN